MSVQLSLASASGVPGGTVSLNLSIATTGLPGCTDIQWGFLFPGDLTLLSVSLGAAGVAASKTISQSGNTILVTGANTNVIGDGVLVVAVFQISANPSAQFSVVALGGIVASDVNGNVITSAGASGTVSYPSPPTSCQPAPVPSYTPNLGALQEPVELTGS